MYCHEVFFFFFFIKSESLVICVLNWYNQDVIVIRASTNVDSRGDSVGDVVEGSVASPTPKVGVLSPSKRTREEFANEVGISYLEEIDG